MANTPALPEEFTIYALAGLRKEWLAKLPKVSRAKRAAAREPAPWLLDGAAVAEIDAAAVQLLISLAQALSARQRRLVIANASARLAAACELLGVASLLDGEAATGVAA